MARRKAITLPGSAASCSAWLCLAWPALASQGPGVTEGTAGPVERALALAFILALPLTLMAIGLNRNSLSKRAQCSV